VIPTFRTTCAPALGPACRVASERKYIPSPL